MAGRSASVAGLISGEDMGRRLEGSRGCRKGRRYHRRNDECPLQTKSPGQMAGAWCVLEGFARSVALSKELQQQREQVDEVQVERQGAGDRRAFRHVTPGRGVAVDVLVLQPLGIPGG